MKRLSIFVFVILTMLILSVNVFSAYSETHIKLLTDDDGDLWRVDTRTGMIVSGKIDSSWFEFPSEIEGYKIKGFDSAVTKDLNFSLIQIVIPEGYTHIGDYAFDGCQYLESVVIPDSVKYIGYRAFGNCKSLKKVELPRNLEYIGAGAFHGCELIEEVSIPDGIDTIKESTFSNCKSLKSVKLPDTIVSIGDYAFSSSGISRMVIPDGVTDFGGNIFYSTPWLNNFESDFVVVNNVLICYQGNSETVEVPSTVHALSDYVFEGCSAKSIKLPNTLTKIGDYAFSSTANLEKLTMPDSVCEIGIGLFYKSAVKEVILSSQITKIPEYTFSRSNVKNLCLTENITEIGPYAYEYAALTSILATTITIPANIKLIDDHAFENTLTWACKIVLPDEITLGERIFVGAYITEVIGGEKAVFKGTNPYYSTPWWNNMKKTEWMTLGDGNLVYCKFNNSEADMIIPEGIKRICYEVMSGTSSKRIICPSTLEEILPKGFSGVDAQEIVLNAGIKRIGEDAFASCRKLVKINWPNHISRIPNKCFYGCSSLKDFDFMGVYELGESCFSGTCVLTDSSLPAHIRRIEKNAFRGSTFSDFYLEALPEDGQEYCFGEDSAEYIYLHVKEGTINHNPEWNMHSLVIDTKVEIVESGEDWMILYFKYGFENYFTDGINIDGRYNYEFGSPMYEVIDGYHIKVSNIYSYLFGTVMKFDDKVSNGWGLVQYEPIYVGRHNGTIYAFTYSREGEITGYIGDVEYVEIPEKIDGITITKVADGIFTTGNMTVYIPSTITEFGVKEIGTGTGFEVSPQNLYYSAHSGCLYSALGARLLCCALDDKEWTSDWHENVREIGDFAFCNSTIEEIEIPYGVIYIGDNIFGKGNHIKYIKIPDGIQNIGSNISQGNTVVVFDGAVMKIKPGAFGENTRAYANDNYDVNGNTIRKQVTSTGIFSLFTPEIDNENGKVCIPLFVKPGRHTNAYLISEIEYEDETCELFMENVVCETVPLCYEYDVNKKVKCVRTFIWNIKNMAPLAYSESVSVDVK